MPLHMLVSGRRACFRRPEFKRDLITYDVITPSAARIIFDRVYRPLGLLWSLERIEILKPIQRGWEITADERRILALQDVAYCLSSSLNDSAGIDHSEDHEAEFSRQVSAAPGNAAIHLGLREFPAQVGVSLPVTGAGWTDGPLDLGWIPFDTGKGSGAAAQFFHAIAVAGAIDLTNLTPASFAI